MHTYLRKSKNKYNFHLNKNTIYKYMCQQITIIKHSLSLK